MNHWMFDRGEWPYQDDGRTEFNVSAELDRMGFDHHPFMRFGDFDRFGELAVEVHQAACDQRHLFEVSFWGGQESESIVTTDFPSFLQLLSMLGPIVDCMSRHNNFPEYMARMEERLGRDSERDDTVSH